MVSIVLGVFLICLGVFFLVGMIIPPNRRGVTIPKGAGIAGATGTFLLSWLLFSNT